MRSQSGAYAEIQATFAMAATPLLAQITCQDDYTFQTVPGYCEANVCPTEGILSLSRSLLYYYSFVMSTVHRVRGSKC